jgi:hypothetical protein
MLGRHTYSGPDFELLELGLQLELELREWLRLHAMQWLWQTIRRSILRQYKERRFMSTLTLRVQARPGQGQLQGRGQARLARDRICHRHRDLHIHLHLAQ